jgi:hypothetical protein
LHFPAILGGAIVAWVAIAISATELVVALVAEAGVRADRKARLLAGPGDEIRKAVVHARRQFREITGAGFQWASFIEQPDHKDTGDT